MYFPKTISGHTCIRPKICCLSIINSQPHPLQEKRKNVRVNQRGEWIIIEELSKSTLFAFLTLCLPECNYSQQFLQRWICLPCLWKYAAGEKGLKYFSQKKIGVERMCKFSLYTTLICYYLYNMIKFNKYFGLSLRRIWVNF